MSSATFDVFNTALGALVARSYSGGNMAAKTLMCSLLHSTLVYVQFAFTGLRSAFINVLFNIFFHQFINQFIDTVKRSCTFQFLGNCAMIFVLRDPIMCSDYFNFEK